MVSIEKYKQYRRIYPKLRLSYSLFRVWLRANSSADYDYVWRYLSEMPYISTEAQTRGKLIHKYIEGIDIQKQIHDIVRDQNYIVDYKSGSLSGYEKQLNYYAWLLKKANFNELGYFKEKKIEVDCGNFIASGIPDLLCLHDGTATNGLLVGVKSKVDANNNIIGVEISKTMDYELNQKWIEDWEFYLDELNNDLTLKIQEGEFDDWLIANSF